MHRQSKERAFEDYIEEIQLTHGHSKSGSNEAVERLGEYRTARTTAARQD